MCETLRKFEESRRSLNNLLEEGFIGVGNLDEEGFYVLLERGNIRYRRSSYVGRDGPDYFITQNIQNKNK